MRKAGFILLTMMVLIGLCYLSAFLMMPTVQQVEKASPTEELAPTEAPNPIMTFTTLDWVIWVLATAILAGLALLILVAGAFLLRAILEGG